MGKRMRGANLPTSPATLLSRPEKIISQPSKAAGLHSWTGRFPSFSDKGTLCFHRTASLYSIPADLEDAPRACNFNWGWPARRMRNLCPTDPVHPSTPIALFNYQWCWSMELSAFWLTAPLFPRLNRHLLMSGLWLIWISVFSKAFLLENDCTAMYPTLYSVRSYMGQIPGNPRKCV